MQSRISTLLITAIVLTLATAAGGDDHALMIPYSKNTGLAAGTYTFIFSLWDTPAGGDPNLNLVWEEQKSVKLTTPTVSTKLGDVVPLNPSDFQEQLYVAVEKVEGDGSCTVLGTRTMLTMAPYALWSAAGGEVTSVAAGSGLERTGSGGAVTLSVKPGLGLTTSADERLTLATAGVKASMLAGGAVTSAKLANKAVVNAKIADGAVTDAKIAGPIAAAKINPAGLDADTVDGKHGGDLIAKGQPDAVSTDMVLDSAITAEKIAPGAVTDAGISGPISAAKISALGLAADTLDGKEATEFAASGVNSDLTSLAGLTGQAAITLNPYGTDPGTTSEVRFQELAAGGENYVGFKAPSLVENSVVWSLPASEGSAGQLLTTNGAGILSWTTDGGGTVQSVATGSGLTGGPITGSGTIAIAPRGVTNAMLQSPSLSILTGGGLTGGGAIGLGGSRTIGLATTGVAAGSYARGNFTVDAQGRLIAAANGPAVDLASEVTETLGVAHGGTGAATGAGALTSLGAVNKAGDTMGGRLNLPANGLTVGSKQLVVTGGKVGIGAPAPTQALEVKGNIKMTGAGNGVTFADGTRQTTAVTNGGAGVPAGFSILGDTPVAPPGYTYTGEAVVSTERWTTRASMPTARFGQASVVVNTKIYTVGGHNASGQGCYATNEEYDPVADTWATRASMPTARGSLVAGTVNGKVYALGGFVSGVIGVGANEEYDPLTDTWTTKAAMLTARGAAAGGVVNDKIYVFGGTIDSSWSVTYSTNEEYDPATDTWTTKASMPTARGYHGAAVINNKIYAIGGGISWWALSATNEEYDPASNAWTTKASMPTGKKWTFATIVLNQKICVVGGSPYINVVLSSMEEFDPLNNVWATRATNMPTARAGLSGAVVNDRVYLIGGTAVWGGSSVLSTNEEYWPKSYYVHRKD